MYGNTSGLIMGEAKRRKNLGIPPRDKTEDINFEEVARFSIYEAYILSDYYHGFRVACENIFETCNKEIQTVKPLPGQEQSNDFLLTKKRCDTEIRKAILYLNDRTGIPHGHRFDDKNPEYHVTEPELHFDYLPFTVCQVTPEPPKMITLRFDIEQGIQHQLENAATKIQDELAKTRLVASASIAPSKVEVPSPATVPPH